MDNVFLLCVRSICDCLLILWFEQKRASEFERDGSSSSMFVFFDGILSRS